MQKKLSAIRACAQCAWVNIHIIYKHSPVRVELIEIIVYFQLLSLTLYVESQRKSQKRKINELRKGNFSKKEKYINVVNSILLVCLHLFCFPVGNDAYTNCPSLEMKSYLLYEKKNGKV